MPVEMTSGLPVAASRDQAVVGEVAARHLVGVEAELLEHRHDVLGKRRRHHRQAVRRARVDDHAMRVEFELELGEESCSDAAFTCAGAGHERRHQPIGVERLQLDRARAGRGGRVHHLERARRATRRGSGRSRRSRTPAR